MGIQMNYGTCRYGPFDGKSLAHGEATYPVAIDKFSKKPQIGVLHTTEMEERYDFGIYRWAPLNKEWIWKT